MRASLPTGLDVTEFVEAELDRRDPDRARMRPTDPESRDFPVADVVGCIVNEEWCHHQYATRDLAVLERSARSRAE